VGYLFNALFAGWIGAYYLASVGVANEVGIAIANGFIIFYYGNGNIGGRWW
jgi:hypothetical protein